jgi:hypothetical protein
MAVVSTVSFEEKYRAYINGRSRKLLPENQTSLLSFSCRQSLKSNHYFLMALSKLLLAKSRKFGLVVSAAPKWKISILLVALSKLTFRRSGSQKNPPKNTLRKTLFKNLKLGFEFQTS